MPNPCQIDGDQAYSDQLTDIYSAGLSRMADRLTSGQLTLDEWHQQMKDALDKMYVFQAMAGVNGDQTRVDTTAIQSALTEQYQYLDGFAAAIESAAQGGTSLGFVANRATMYAKSSQAEYWRQAAGVDLPAVPKDGSTACMMNCGCHWETECDSDGNVLATWVMDDALENCEDCKQRAKDWAPLVIAADKARLA